MFPEIPYFFSKYLQNIRLHFHKYYSKNIKCIVSSKMAIHISGDDVLTVCIQLNSKQFNI